MRAGSRALGMWIGRCRGDARQPRPEGWLAWRCRRAEPREGALARGPEPGRGGTLPLTADREADRVSMDKRVAPGTETGLSEPRAHSSTFLVSGDTGPAAVRVR